MTDNGPEFGGNMSILNRNDNDNNNESKNKKDKSIMINSARRLFLELGLKH